MSAQVSSYPIGTPGTAWKAVERAAWLASRTVRRSYADEVIAKLEDPKHAYRTLFDLKKYGSLSHDADRYPLYAAVSRDWSTRRPSILITGGVHGYETSGVQGAIAFLLSDDAVRYAEIFNIVVAPCVSPWGYETIERWNAQAIDPNRSFNPDGEIVPGRSFNPEAATDESAALIALLASLQSEGWMCHIDLHETTDSDESEFRPAKAARDGKVYTPGSIPDGFYLVADATNPQLEWHAAMIAAVSDVTHIAPADAAGKIIDEDVISDGVIGIPSPKSIGLCSGVTDSKYATTTEVYPDSASASDEICNRAQVACITAGLNFIIRAEGVGG